MAYNATTGIITAPVSIQDLAQCFKVRIKKGSNYRYSHDLGRITNQKQTTIPTDGWVVDSREYINIWSKYKPVDNTAIQYMSQWNAAQNKWKDDATWFHGWGADWRYGFDPQENAQVPAVANIRTGSALKSFLVAAYGVSDGLNGWAVHLPAGDNFNHPYRMTDYAGYNHKAHGIGDSFTVVTPITISNLTNQGTISALFAYAPDDGTNVTPENFLPVTNTLKVYFGVLLAQKNSTNVFYGTAPAPNEVTIQEEVSLPQGQSFIAYPFMALLDHAHAFSDNDESMKVYSIPLLQPVNVTTASSSQTINLNISAEYKFTGYTTAEITITTFSSSYNNCWIELTSGSTTFVVTLGTWSGRNVSGTIVTSGSSTKFSLSAIGSGDYVITLTNLNPNLRYQGKLYVDNSITKYKGFGIMEQIDPNA